MKRERDIWYEHMDPQRWRPEYPDGSMSAYLKTIAREHWQKKAVIFEGKTLTFGQLIESIEQAAAGLARAGIRRGDVVSVISPNTPQALFTIYAVNRLGAVANMIHPLLSAQQIQWAVERAESKAIVILDLVYPKIAKLEWTMQQKPLVILTRVIDGLPWYAKPVYALKNRKKTAPAPGILIWNEMLASGETAPEDHGKADDVAMILYSGGTTGTPKGVMLTNGNLNALALQTYDVGGVPDCAGSSALALMPLFHGFGFGVCVHGMLCQGIHIYLLAKYDFMACTKLIFQKRINLVFGVPALFEAIIRSPQIDRSDLSFFKLLVCGGDRLPESLKKRVDRCMARGGSGASLREAYGQTECVAGCNINPWFDIRSGSVGIAYPDMKLKIVQPGTCRELPVGEEGELCVCGPTVMAGYFDEQEATAAALRVHEDGLTWLHTGDIFSMDEDGYCYFRRRIGRMAICAGYNVYLPEVEEAVNASPVVAQCCAVGLPDRLLGSRIAVGVVLREGIADQEAAREQIASHCRERLAQYAQPRKVVFLEELPRTNLGKVDYQAVQALLDR